MSQKNYTFPVDGDKLDAIESYLKKEGNISFLDEELNVALNRVYRKSVPKNVRDYIEMRAGKGSAATKKRDKNEPTEQQEPTPTVTEDAPQNGASYRPKPFVSQNPGE